MCMRSANIPTVDIKAESDNFQKVALLPVFEKLHRWEPFSEQRSAETKWKFSIFNLKYYVSGA